MLSMSQYSVLLLGLSLLHFPGPKTSYTVAVSLGLPTYHQESAQGPRWRMVGIRSWEALEADLKPIYNNWW